MKVTLIQHDPDALEILLFTKQTRLKMSPDGLEAIKAWPMEKKLEQLEYMRNTIQSSWEFASYTFAIEDVTRAFTHQFVRHRHNSYAQQAQRAVDMTGFKTVKPDSVAANPIPDAYWDEAMEEIEMAYKSLVANGIPAQDARGVLPTNVCTNIVFKANLRSLHDMMLKRLCVKAQGEAQDVFREIRAAVVAVHPWADKFLRVYCATTGTCCFPTYPTKDCPVKSYVYNPETQQAYGSGRPLSLENIQEIWEANRAEAQPDIKA